MSSKPQIVTSYSDKLFALASAIRSLPLTASGKFEENQRVLILANRANVSELQLRLAGRDDPLLNAKILIPRDPEIPPTISSVTDRQERLLAAMISWALQHFLSTPLVLVPSAVRPEWKRQLRIFMSAAANDSGSTARGFFQRRGDLLEDLTDSQRALDACYYLRDCGKAIHIDWKECDSILPLCIDLLVKVKRKPAAASLTTLKPRGGIDAILSSLQSRLSKLELQINKIETYDDSYLFFLTSSSSSEDACRALGVLGATAAPATIAESSRESGA